METLETVLLILLVTDAVALGVLVLLQQGKGADVGAAFGSGAANAVFGGQGSASFLSRVTTWLAIGFFLISFGLAYTAKEKAASLGSLGIPTVTETPVELPEDGLLMEEDIPLADEPLRDIDPPGDGTDLNREADRVDSEIPDI